MITEKLKAIKFFTIIAVLFLLNACSKVETNNDVPSTVNNLLSEDKFASDKNANSSGLIPSIALYNASSATLQNHYQTFISTINTNPPLGGKPLACPILWNSSSIVRSAVLRNGTSFCDGTAIVDVTYRWLVWESGSGGGPSGANYSFGVNAGLGILNPTNINLISTVTLSCDPNMNPCPHLKTYDITVALNATEYSSSQTNNRINGYGPNSCNSTFNIDQNVTLDFPNTYYTDNPARIFVSPVGTGSLSVLTECSLLCFPPHTQCPTNGTFTYRLLPSGAFTTVNIPTSGLIINNLVPGNYEYQSVLTYPFGNSQVATGTFTIQ